MSAPTLRYGLKEEIHRVRPQEAKKRKNRSYSMEAEGADFRIMLKDLSETD